MHDDNGLPICPACREQFAQRVTYTCAQPGLCLGNEVTFLKCGECGLTYAPDNDHIYDSENDFAVTSQPVATPGRTGSDARPGREYMMGVMAEDILRRTRRTVTSILVFGAGLSRDHAWLAKTFPGANVQVCDLKNMQHLDNYIRPNSTQRFDIVIACEVVEHFVDIPGNFAMLLSKAADDGLVVLSTNISDGGSLESLIYPYARGHTAYYSGRSLAMIASRFDPGLRVDFRLPHAALGQLGPRKRYVLIFRDDKIATAIAEYFSEHAMAPSEEIHHEALREKLERWIRRRWSGRTIGRELRRRS
jgi:hypothetical protein